MTAPTVEAREGLIVEVDPRKPSGRLAALLDTDSATLLHPPDDSNVQAVRGRINGNKVIAYCTDASVMGGAIGGIGGRHIASAIDTAVRDRCPVIGLWHSGGARLGEGVESMDGIGRMFSAMIHASGRVPQLSVVLGPAAGGAAYGPALTDLVIMAPASRVFVTGPDVVRSVTGEEIDMTGLGGPEAHGRKSGVVHAVADSEPDAIDRARRITGLLAAPGHLDLRAVADDRDLGTFLPENPRRAYDVRPLVHALVDTGTFEELQPKWAANMVIGLGRLGRRTIGVVANNPLRKGGCLDSLSAEKAARFVRMCDSFGVPLVVVVDVPGYLPGVRQEWEGVVRRGAKLLYAFGEAVVPRITLVTRKSYGGAYIAMNSRSLGASAVFAWPDAEVAVMGAEAAVKILRRKQLAAAAEDERDQLLDGLAEEHRRTVGGIDRGIDLGVVDEVIAPAHSRRRIAEALSLAPASSGHHGNIPL
jgi:acetyl-CoA/propionyl-CoA carboxylase carboxyl transferase subunit